MKRRATFAALSFLLPQLVFADCALMVEPQTPKTVPNLVAEPEYNTKSDSNESEDEDATEPEKLQYVPMTAEMPLLEEREGAQTRAAGAQYEKGSELYLTPQSGYKPMDEEIHEDTAQTTSN